jgi:Ca2+-dependent lipid-binding protein
MDVIGSADPYFVAKLDHSISYVYVSQSSFFALASAHKLLRSSVQINTLSPVWNEVWMIKNVPTTADLEVEVLDKDAGAARDDYVGKFTTTVTPGTKEVEIQGPTFGRKNRGTFWLKV